MIEYHTYRSLFYFRRISVSLSHDSILSQNEVSDNPGAVHTSGWGDCKSYGYDSETQTGHRIRKERRVFNPRVPLASRETVLAGALVMSILPFLSGTPFMPEDKISTLLKVNYEPCRLSGHVRRDENVR